ncbi:MAG: PKD domain-containing protein [Acidobacteriota bacterium]
MKPHVAPVVALFASLLAVARVDASNLLSAPGFDQSLLGWSSPAASWNSADALGLAGSGSARGTSSAAAASAVVRALSSTCVPATAGVAYESSLDTLIGSGQTGIGFARVDIRWYGAADCGSSSLLAEANLITTSSSVGAWQRTAGGSALAPAGAHSALVDLSVVKVSSGGSLAVLFDNVVVRPSTTCANLPDVLCLGDRFAVTGSWRTSSASGKAFAHGLTADTGYFWFFDSSAVEAVVKVLDGCGLNQRYWVFAGGLTDVNVVLTVTDAKTHAEMVYTNPASTKFQPIQDTSAFATCPESPDAPTLAYSEAVGTASLEVDQLLGESSRVSGAPAEESAAANCVSGPMALCLNSGRFRVTAHFDDGAGSSGAARVVQLTADTGYMWFFSSSSVETVVKVLNGCGNNGHYWIFAGGLTDVSVDLTIADTTTGSTRTYTNPAHTKFQPIQDTSAFSDCPAAGDLPPHAALSATCEDLHCRAQTNSTDDVGITSYRWDWGDGTPPVEATSSDSQTHTYAHSGRFTIVHTVVDTAGQTDSNAVDVVADAPPMAVDDAATTYRDVPITIDVLANDTDPDGDALSISGTDILVRYPGAAYQVLSSGGSWLLKITPPDSYVGVLTFVYTAADPLGQASTAVVSLTVKQWGTREGRGRNQDSLQPPEVR